MRRYGAGEKWIGLSFRWPSIKSELLEFWVYLPLGWFTGRNRRQEYLDYTIGKHSRWLLFSAWYAGRDRNCKPRNHGLHFWRLHCDWQVKLYPDHGECVSDPDLGYMDIQEGA